MRNVFLIVLTAIALALSGCANGPQKRSPTEYNTEYMAAVEYHANRAGVEVEWVNPPRRTRVLGEDDDS